MSNNDLKPFIGEDSARATDLLGEKIIKHLKSRFPNYGFFYIWSALILVNILAILSAL